MAETVRLALKKMRKMHPGRLTQRAVAEGTGISYGNYNKKENGEVAVTLSDLDRLSKFYGVPAWKILLHGSDENDRDNSSNGESMKRIIELTDVITTLNKIIKDRDDEIERLKEAIKNLSP